MRQRAYQILFVFLLLPLCWLAMQLTHEAGHIIGAWLTGGEIGFVDLHPLRISRTDVLNNQKPTIVVWLGPIFGIVLPLFLWCAIPNSEKVVKRTWQFFVGFCCIANGAYIGAGSFSRVGDCKVMLQHGTPIWTMHGFGLLATLLGIYLWHRLGSFGEFWLKPETISARAVLGCAACLVAILILDCVSIILQA